MNNKKLTDLEIIEYSQELGIQSEIDLNRIKQIYNLAVALCPEELESVFISNHLELDKKIHIKHIWFFSANYVIEALDFLKPPVPRLGMTVLRENIRCISMTAENYEVSREPDDKSFLGIRVDTWSDLQCDFMATGKNCRNLMNVFEEYLKKNVVRCILLDQPTTP